MEFHQLLERNSTASAHSHADDRPSYYKAIGIGLAVGSGAFIGTSFVLKKVGLLRANEKYNEVAGEGYGYLKNVFWWSGMTLMIIGEICNFVAYAFTDAILVTPLGALSVVITTVLSAIFLKERLSMVGKVACFLCIVGSVVIVMNAPQESSVSDIQEMQHYVIAPGFLSYAGVIIIGSVITAFFVGPKYGKKNMLVYISICSWIGGLSVVATQGLGAAIIAWIGGSKQYKEWFLWVLFVFVICTLVTEIIFLNKALNLFNAALVTPTYYVYFTSTTIITSAVLFQGFKGTATSIVTVVMGFLTICSGVVLLQLSKSAKDVPDAAVFTGDLDQIQTIAEQEQPESEPKADAIRGTAAIVRRISQARMRMEANELKRLHEEKAQAAMEPISEDGQPQWEWDGLRRRKTIAMSQRSRSTTMPSSSTPVPPRSPVPTVGSPMPSIRSPHPPLGMSRFPTDEELEEHEQENRASILSSIVGTIRSRSKTSATMPAYADDVYPNGHKPPSPMQHVPLTEISISGQKPERNDSYPGQTRSRDFALGLPPRSTEYKSTPGSSDGKSLAPPTPPPHSSGSSAPRRHFSFQKVFMRSPTSPSFQLSKSQSEEERVGLVMKPDGSSQAAATSSPHLLHPHTRRRGSSDITQSQGDDASSLRTYTESGDSDDEKINAAVKMHSQGSGQGSGRGGGGYSGGRDGAFL